MSLKIHFLDSHLNFFPENLGDVSKRFHQDISTFETSYQGKYNSKMLVDYCWILKMNLIQAKHCRKANKNYF